MDTTLKLQYSLAQTDRAKFASFRMDLKYYTKSSYLDVSHTRAGQHSGTMLSAGTVIDDPP